jgi:hypothetical protein
VLLHSSTHHEASDLGLAGTAEAAEMTKAAGEAAAAAAMPASMMSDAQRKGLLKRSAPWLSGGGGRPSANAKPAVAGRWENEMDRTADPPAVAAKWSKMRTETPDGHDLAAHIYVTSKQTDKALKVSRLENQERAKHVLICAPSNAAVDEILSRLVTHGIWNADGKEVCTTVCPQLFALN